MKKNVLIGGYTAQEAKNLLLIRGLEHVKAIIPHNVPKNVNLAQFDDLPAFWFDYVFQGALIEHRYGYSELENGYYNGYYYEDGIYRGKIRGIAIRLDLKLCYDCSYSLQDYLSQLSKTIRYYPDVRQHYCELCGKWENDDIPF